MSVEVKKPVGFLQEEPLLFDYPDWQAEGVNLGQDSVAPVDAAKALKGAPLRPDLAGLPNVSEFDVVRHYTRLSRANYSVDTGMYPLGSCTMKYNPRINETAAALPGFAQLHPLAPASQSQGMLALLYQTQQWLCEVTGFDHVSLAPAAGAQGELTGVLLIRAAHQAKGEDRPVMLVPDSAHGTNPASAALAGFTVREVKSGPDGCIDLEDLKAKADHQTAGLMLTNPNTLGIFEKDIVQIAQVIHQAGGYVYCDGANMNAQMGFARPGDYGMDVLHLNLHKTFSTPHGGGGPGSGPCLCSAELAPYLPVPRVVRQDGAYRLDWDAPYSIGMLTTFWGNVGVVVRAYSYLLAMGGEGLKEASETAVLNANYMRHKLSGVLKTSHTTPTLHEVIFTDETLKPLGISTSDLAKRLIDHGFHPPTVYFPLTVPGALMVEPTETEPKAEMDRFIEAVVAVLEEAARDPEVAKGAPHTAPRRRLDETLAARQPVLRWTPGG